jgi:hypothetical protein
VIEKGPLSMVSTRFGHMYNKPEAPSGEVSPEPLVAGKSKADDNDQELNKEL